MAKGHVNILHLTFLMMYVVLTPVLLLTRGLSGIVFWIVEKCRNWWEHKFHSMAPPPRETAAAIPATRDRRTSSVRGGRNRVLIVAALRHRDVILSAP